MTQSNAADQTEVKNAEEQPTMSRLWDLVQDQRRELEMHKQETDLQREQSKQQQQHIEQLKESIGSLLAKVASLNQTPDGPDSAIARQTARLSRKGLLGAAAAGAAGLAGAALLKPQDALAAGSSADYFDATALSMHVNSGFSTSGASNMYVGVNAGGTSAGVLGWDYASGDQFNTVPGGTGVMGAGLTYGVYGFSSGHLGAGAGVYGSGTSGVGVQGTATSWSGVSGNSTSSSGVYGNSVDSTGVEGYSANGTGVDGYGGAYGGSFNGGLAPLLLVPAGTTGAPTSLTYYKGAIVVDSLGVPYICGAGGTPGTWQAIGNLRSFPAGHRVFNSSMTPSGLATGISALTDVHGTSTGVPVTATAVYCAVQSYESGTLTIFPDGASEPPQANWSGVGTSGILNLLYMLVPLSAAGKFSIRSHLVATGKVYVDVWGYLM